MNKPVNINRSRIEIIDELCDETDYADVRTSIEAVRRAEEDRMPAWALAIANLGDPTDPSWIAEGSQLIRFIAENQYEDAARAIYAAGGANALVKFAIETMEAEKQR
jgi:hypothetical protein